MLATHVIATDPSRHLVRVTLTGFFELEEVAGFVQSLRDTHKTLRCPPNAQLTLIDCTRIQIQSQAVVSAFAAIAQDPTLLSRRTAVIVGTSLARGQVRRVFPKNRETLDFFNDRATAEAWLLGPPVTAARTVSRYLHAPALPRSDGRDCTVPNGG